MKLSKDKDFLAFLKKNKVQVKNGMIPLDQADSIPDLLHAYKVGQAKTKGAPASVKKLDAKGVMDVEYDDLPRGNQDETEYNLELVDSHKNYDEGTWGATLRGKASDIYMFLVDGSDVDPDAAEDAIIMQADELGWTI